MELLRFKNSQKYMVFDFETCSLNLGSLENKPWQLAFMVIENGKVKESCDYWLKWEGLKVSKEAAKITGWTKKKYEKNAVDPKKPLEHFEKYLYDDEYIKMAHNGLGFDIYVHSIYRQLLGMNPDYSYLNKMVDTNCLAKSVKCNIDFDKNAGLLAWQYKLYHHIKKGVRTSLKECCKYYSIDFDPSKLHDALYDIQKNYEVFKKLVWDVEI